MEVRRHSPVAVTADHDLVSLLLGDAVSDIVGTPTPRRRGGRTYWYDRYRVGDAVRERYLGEDTGAMRARVEGHADLAAARTARRRERARLVRLLRGERFLGMDAGTGRLVAALARAGASRLGGALVGTHAFRLYEGELGLRLSFDQTATTDDVDIASFGRLSVALGDAVEPALDGVFRDLAFEPAPSGEPGRTWRWRQVRGGTFVEFLTPSFSEREDLRDLPALGVSAQSLHHLDYLLAEPLHAAAVYREGVLVQVPSPERFAIHKLIVADRRIGGPDSLKARKDLMQAELLLAILAEDRPQGLAEAYAAALARGPRWRERIARSLGRSAVSADLLRTADG